MLVLDLGKLTQQLFLPGRQIAWCLDENFDELVASAATVHIRHAPSLDSQHLPTLCSARNLNPVGTVERGHLDLGPQRRLREADRNLTI